MSSGDRNLVLWAGCVMQRDLLERAEAAVAGGFSCMSILCGDLVAHERAGGSVRDLARELEARGAPIPILDPFLASYPGRTGAQVNGAQGDSQNIDPDTVLRYAEETGAPSLSVLTPFHGTPAPREAALDALGRFADHAAAIDLALHIEVIPTSMTPDLASRLGPRAGRRARQRRPRARHVPPRTQPHDGRELAAIPANRIFHVQLCDAPREPRIPDYFEEAVTIRDFAGDGELGVLDMARCLDEMGALDNVGPEVFSAELDAMSPAHVGQLCRTKTDEFLTAVGGAYERA